MGVVVAAGIGASAVQPASAATKAEELQNRANEVKTEMAELRDTLETLNATCETDGTTACINGMVDVMYDLDTTLSEAQVKVYTTLLMAGAQEKRVIRLSIHAIQSELRETIVDLETIAANDSLSEAEKKAEVDALVDEFRTYLESKKGQPQDRIEEFLKLKVKASKVYLSWSLPLAQASADNYQALGYNTNKVEAQIARADALYDSALVLYNEGKDTNDDDDIQNLRKAGVKFIKSRRLLTKAERSLKVMENSWTAQYNPAQ